MTINKNTFTGEFSYSLDSKGRLNIPARFRNVLSKDNQRSFVITRGMDTCVWVYPLEIWLTIENELRKLSSLSRINRSFVRSTVRYASTVQYDKQGRIALSQNLIHYAKLKKDALIMHPGPMNRGIEIDTNLADDINKSVIKEQVELGVAVRMACLKIFCE